MTKRIAICLSLAAGLLAAADFKPYPGAKLDDKASHEASLSGKGESQVYTTSDPLDKVYAFYKPLYPEYKMRRTGARTATGQDVVFYFFLLDGAGNLISSKYWMKIQHPYVGGADSKDIRDLTVIQTVRLPAQ